MQNFSAAGSIAAHSIPAYQFPARDGAPVAAPQTDIEAKVNIVFAALPSEVPFVRIAHIAPLLGLTDSGLRKYCPQCRLLENWRGDYRFHMDDLEHVKALRALIKLVLWSGRKLPETLQVSYVPTMKLPASTYLH